MATPQDDYAGRLPYGLWFGPEQGREYLFDRGYNAIASRPVDEPWRVEVYPTRKFRDAGPGREERYFHSDNKSPRVCKDAKVRCERILARFVSGRDVRAWLQCNEGKPPLPGCLEPKTKGKYLPDSIPRQTMELTFTTPGEIAADDDPDIDDLLA